MEKWPILTYVNLKTLLLAGATFCAMVNWQKYSARKRLPPGPFPLPVVGSIPFVGKDILVYLRQLAGRYGDVFTVYFGAEPTVVLNGYDVIKEALIKHGHLFSARPSNIQLYEEICKDSGVIFNHSTWQEQRSFVHRVLRDLGMGKSVLQDKILEEIAMFHQELDNQLGQPFNPGTLIHCAVSNIICSIIFGSRFEYGDPDFQDIQQLMNENVMTAGEGQVIVMFPWLRYFPGDLFGCQRYLNVGFGIHKWIKKQKVHEGTESFVRIYQEMMKEDRKKHGDETTFTDRNLLMCCDDLLQAGSETTSTTLRWAIAYMVHHPDIQRKIQHEIDSIIGRGSTPVITDRARLPYTDACLSEILRLSAIVPLSLPHCATDDVILRGHAIPKGTAVLVNLHSALRDETWQTPDSFNPNHFLSPEGEVVRNEHLIPFSLGKRVCVGEALAKMELFLYFTSTLQKFTITKGEGEPLPDMEGQLGITLGPKPFKVTFNKRQ